MCFHIPFVLFLLKALIILAEWVFALHGPITVQYLGNQMRDAML